MTHAVSRLRADRLARSRSPRRVRGMRAERCAHCRVPASHCLCSWRPRVPTQAGFCLLMHDVEACKPTNTGWLVADVVPGTVAFPWSRTAIDPALLALLQDPGWQPYVVFPEEYSPPQHVVREVATTPARRPLFVLLDATWREARRMFRHSPYLEGLPVLSPRSEQLSRYQLRRARREAHLCTAEVAALCLELAGEVRAASALDAWLDLFIAHYTDAKSHRPSRVADEMHARVAAYL